MVIERLADHDRSSFDCGEPSLNRFLKEQASQFRKRGLCVTYVVVPNSSDPRIIGYYTVSSSAIEPQDVPSGNLPSRLRIPVILLGQFAVDKQWQGQAIGKRMLYDALRRSLMISEQLGVHGVVLDALNESAKQFYLKRGFIELIQGDRGSMRLFISMREIKKLGFDL